MLILFFIFQFFNSNKDEFDIQIMFKITKDDYKV